MKLSHSDLIKAGQSLGYHDFNEGLCRGFTFVLALSILSGDAKSIYAILDLLENYYTKNQGQFRLLAQTINQIRREKHDGFWDDDRQKYLEIPAFFDAIALSLTPGNYLDLFDKPYVDQIDIEIIYPFVQSKFMEEIKPSLVILMDKSYAFTRKDLKDWLIDLEIILRKTSVPIAMMVDNERHSICLEYHQVRRCWILTDTNDFELFPDEEIYSREMNTEELVHSLFVSFFDENSEHTLFTTTLLAINPDKSLKDNLKTLDKAYPIKPKHVRFYNSNDSGLLLLACQNRDLDVVDRLLQYGADIDNINKDGLTALHVACKIGGLDLVCKLLEFGAKTNNNSYKGMTPFFLACELGHVAIVETLIGLMDSKSIDIFANDQTSPLFMACKNGHLKVVEALLHCGANVDIRAGDEYTPLHIACKNGQSEIVGVLIDYGANVNQKGFGWHEQNFTPLHLACKMGHSEIVQILLNSGANIGHTDSYNNNSLDIACEYGQLEIIELLLDFASDANEVIDINGGLIKASQRGQIEVVIKLLSYARLNQIVVYGDTLLQIACNRGDTDLIRILLHSGTYSHIDAFFGNTRNTHLLIACSNHVDFLIFGLLLQYGADMTHKNAQGKTALDIAFEYNNDGAIRELLQHAKNNNLFEKRIMSKTSYRKALTWTSSNGSSELIQDILHCRDGRLGSARCAPSKFFRMPGVSTIFDNFEKITGIELDFRI